MLRAAKPSWRHVEITDSVGRRFARDRNGAVELPLRLLIALVALAIVLPIVFALFTGYSRLDVHRVIRESLDRIFINARQVAIGGNDTMRTVRVTFPSGLFNTLQSVDIGDTLRGNNLRTARYQISGEPLTTIVMSSPNVPMTNARNEPLKLGSGTHELIVWHWITTDFSFVVVDREGAETEFGRFDASHP